jgi:hypothetical protein
MRGTGGATNTDCVNLRLLAFALLVSFGCSAVTGRPLGSQPPRYPMLAAAKSAVQGTGLALPRELDLQVLPPYVVEPGDVLLVVAVDLDSPVRMPGDQPVLPDGTINLGRYGRIVVAGRTVNEIEAVVHAAVQAQAGGKDIGAISVRLMTRVSKVYYVLGEVNAWATRRRTTNWPRATAFLWPANRPANSSFPGRAQSHLVRAGRNARAGHDLKKLLADLESTKTMMKWFLARQTKG